MGRARKLWLRLTGRSRWEGEYERRTRRALIHIAAFNDSVATIEQRINGKKLDGSDARPPTGDDYNALFLELAWIEDAESILEGKL